MALIHGGIILIRYGWHTNCTDQLLQPQYICLSDYSLVNSEKFTNFALLNTDLYSIIALCILRHDMKKALKKYLWIIISIISVVSLESMYECMHLQAVTRRVYIIVLGQNLKDIISPKIVKDLSIVLVK